MKFIAIPDPRRGAVTKEQLAELRSMAVLPGTLGAFASVAHFAEVGGVGLPSEGPTAKYWRDNATIWNPSQETYEYVMLERDANGNFAQAPLNFSDPVWEILSFGCANFYRQYAAHFPVVPKLVRKTMPRFDAGRINFAAKGIAEDYPLGVSGGFPANVALRFNPGTGEPEAFNFEEYVREFPFDWTPKAPPVPGSGGKLSDEELVGATSGLLASPLSIKEKAAAIRQLANR